MTRGFAVAVGGIAVLAGFASEYARQVWIQPLWVPIIDLAIGQLLVGCGLIAAVARPQQPAGRRLVLAGFLWIIAAPRQWFPNQGRTDDFLQLDMASFTLIGWSDAVLSFIALSFSARWPLRRRERAAAVALVCAFAFQTVVRVLANADVFFGIESSDVAWNLQGVADLGRIVVLAVAGVLIVQRWRSASGPARHFLGPVLLAGAVVGFVPLFNAWYPFSQWGLIDPISDAVAIPAFWVANALRLLVPIAMLTGILRQRGSRAAVAHALSTVSPWTTAADLETALGRALRDPSLRVLMWSRELGDYIDRDGEPATSPAPGAPTAATPVAGPDGPLALLVHDRALAEDATLLAAGVAMTRLVADNARLNRELRRQLDEVRASRARIVETGDAERRRIERDLHDGVQQRLLALALSLRRAASQADEAGAVDALARGADEALGVVTDVRQLAQGIHPAVLTEAGLAAALRALGARSPVPVELEISVDAASDPTATATAYFVASEALANVVKHAAATSATIRALERDGVIRIEVEDDGRGGADSRGAGLRGLEDRLAAVGGTLRVFDRTGGGTVVSAGIPVG
jgi:signal transduction histidine kinase